MQYRKTFVFTFSANIFIKEIGFRVKVKIFKEVEFPRISTQSVHEDCKVVSPTHRSPLPPRRYNWYSFLLEAGSPGP
jgi:hypothetical protein